MESVTHLPLETLRVEGRSAPSRTPRIRKDEQPVAVLAGPCALRKFIGGVRDERELIEDALDRSRDLEVVSSARYGGSGRRLAGGIVVVGGH